LEGSSVIVNSGREISPSGYETHARAAKRFPQALKPRFLYMPSRHDSIRALILPASFYCSAAALARLLQFVYV
jgi:hypothetical protein